MIRDKKTYRVLVIEDNPIDYFLVEEFLTEQIANAVIIHAADFSQVVAIFSSQEAVFDVILLDLSLPDKSGQELINETLRMAGSCPVIILTGYADMEFSIKSISQGVLDYLLKDELNAVTLYKSILYSMERKKAVTDLKESEKRYSDLFHLSPQPMCLYEHGTFRFIKINKAALEQFGYSETEFLEMTLLDLVPVVERQKAIDLIISQDRELNETYFSKSWVHKKSDELIEVETFSTPILINEKLSTLVIAIDVTEKNLYEHTITKAIIKTQEEERYEIGGELHDNVCQILAASLLSLAMMKKLLPDNGIQWYDQCNKYINLASVEIRNLSHRLAPAFFDESTLEEAFKILLKTFNPEDQYKISLYFDKAVGLRNINMELQLNLYRILQEQLKNILKHAQAGLIRVEVMIRDNILTMTVQDDGIGFKLTGNKEGIGLANMKRRTELFSGKFSIDSSPGNGCVLTATIPLP